MSRAARALHPDQEIWLWIQHLPAHYRRLTGYLAGFPGLPELRAACFFDARSTAVLVRLRFAASSGHVERLRGWAFEAGLELVDTSSWSKERRASFGREVEPYRCTGGESKTARAIVGFVQQLMKASLDSMSSEARASTLEPNAQRLEHSDGVPESVEICESLRLEMLRYEVGQAPRRYPRA